MRAVTAARPFRESFILLGSYCDATWAGPTTAPVIVEENMARGAAVVLQLSWAGRTLWAHDASPASICHVVPVMGPGSTVGPVGTRVPMDLSSASPVRWVDEIILSPRREAPGETARKESSRSAKYGRMPEETAAGRVSIGPCCLLHPREAGVLTISPGTIPGT